MGVHQSIGMKGIVLFGTDEQKERFLPGPREPAASSPAFALTEPEAGSDAYNLQSRAVQPVRRLVGAQRREALHRQRLARRGVIVTFARAEVDGKDRHIALILEKGMEGFEVGERYDTMGLRGNDLRHLYFNDVRVPPENVLGEPGDGFQIAMEVLNNGRIEPRHGLGRRRQEAARPGDRARHDPPAVRPSAGRVRARAGEDRLDGLVTCSAWSRWPT